MATRMQISGGGASGVYDDRWLPLFEALGAPRVERASNVEWESGEWVARLPNGEIIARGRNRAQVIQQEISYLEDQG